MKSRFLLIRWGGLGDLLVALPAIQVLRRAFPSAYLTLVGRPGYASLMREAGVIDDVIDGGGLLARRLFSGSEPSGTEAVKGKWLDAFDLVLGWLNQKGSCLIDADVGAPGGGRRSKTISYETGSGKPMNRFFYEKTISVLEIAASAAAGFDECARLPLDSISSGADLLVPCPEPLRRRFVVLHPGSGGEAKRWRLANFLEIARRLKDRGVDGAIVTGEAEASLEREAGEAARSLGWDWLRSPELAPLARLLGGADLYLGNDSGVTHLAACSGAEVIALFRDDLLDVWHPAGRVHVLSAGSLDRIPVEAVWAAVAQVLCI